MSNFAVRVEGLGKEYKIGALVQPNDNFREVLTQAFSAPFRRARNLLRGEAYGAAELSESIWALNDINFEIKHGEVVGIIGHNGAGKSTLLKVLSRITEPTVGIVELYGRVGALLEVGTGFHQELTGRENVYLNGAILGMTRNDIDRKFDEIVNFAGVERFIDTPVKHYSSGMRLRLGFSVAAHLEPEILVIDEVLAVGDAEFQKKCLGKMSDVAGEGRTVLFVSHNMQAVQNLCTRAIWLDHGTIRESGIVSDVISNYLATGNFSESERRWDKDTISPGNENTKLLYIGVKSFEGDVIMTDTDFIIALEYWYDDDRPISPTIRIINEEAVIVFSNAPIDLKSELKPGLNRLECRIPGNLLNSGMYSVYLHFVQANRVISKHPDLVAFHVHPVPRGDWYGKPRGVIAPVLNWSLKRDSESVKV